MLTARDAVADRVGRARCGRRRLPRQALRARGAARAPAGAAAPHGRRRRTAVLRVRRPRRSTRAPARSGAAGGRIELTRTEYDLLELLCCATRGRCSRASADLRARLGLRLRPDVQLARRLHRLPAPQARGRRRAAPDPHGARHRLRAARARDEPCAAALRAGGVGSRWRSRRCAPPRSSSYFAVRGRARAGRDRRTRCASRSTSRQPAPCRRSAIHRGAPGGSFRRLPTRSPRRRQRRTSSSCGPTARCPPDRPPPIPVDDRDARGRGGTRRRPPADDAESTATTCGSYGPRRRPAPCRSRGRSTRSTTRCDCLRCSRCRASAASRWPGWLGRVVARAALAPGAAPRRERAEEVAHDPDLATASTPRPRRARPARRAASTRCSTRSRPRRTSSASSSPTPRTSCARR